MTFSTITRVDPAVPASWEDRTFLCFDIDWAADGVLSDVIDLVERAGVHATWFATHDTPLLARLRANPAFELGIHPNFNKLLFDADASNGKTAIEVLERMRAFAPEARSVRSHSVTQSSRLIEEFGKAGLTHQSNTFIPSGAGVAHRPWRLWNGMTEVPYGWADDAHMVYGWGKGAIPLPAYPSFRVVTFHPIHVFINSGQTADYDACRGFLGKPEKLIGFRRAGAGARAWLESLLAG